MLACTMNNTAITAERKRCKEAGITNLKAQVEDGQALSGFADATVDVVTCSWGLESMLDHQKAIEVSRRFWLLC